MKTIKLPCYGMVIECDPDTGCGTIVSALTVGLRLDHSDHCIEAALVAVEAMVLAQA